MERARPGAPARLLGLGALLPSRPRPRPELARPELAWRAPPSTGALCLPGRGDLEACSQLPAPSSRRERRCALAPGGAQGPTDDLCPADQAPSGFLRASTGDADDPPGWGRRVQVGVRDLGGGAETKPERSSKFGAPLQLGAHQSLESLDQITVTTPPS